MTHKKHIGMVISIALCAAVYLVGIDYGPIPTFDDAGYITNNAVVTDWFAATTWQKLFTPGIGYPIPLPVALYAFATELFGSAYPVFIRIVALSAHLATGVLWYLLLLRRTGNLAATMAATIWLFHPLQAESVMWLANLKSPLQVLFDVASLVVADRVATGDITRPKGIAAIAALTVLALFSKPTGAIAPAAILLPALLEDDHWQAVRKLAPLAAVSALIVAVWAALGFGEHGQMVDISYLVDDSISYRIMSGLAAFRRLFEIVLLPWALGPYYAEPPNIPLVSWVGGLVLTVTCISAFTVALKHDSTKARQAAFALAVIAVFWAPYSHITFIPRFAADTYASGPLLGLSTLMAIGLDKKGRFFALAIAVGLLILAGLQRDRWINGQTLWEPVLIQAPNSASAAQHVAYSLIVDGQVNDARDVLSDHRAAFRVQRNFPVWVAHFYLSQGDTVAALNYLAEAVDLLPPGGKDLNENRSLFLRTLFDTNFTIPAQMADLVKESIKIEKSQPKPALTAQEFDQLTQRIEAKTRAITP